MRVRIFLEDAAGRTDEIEAVSDERLVESIFLSGRFEAPALCSGLGRCGQCKVRVLQAPEPLQPTKAEERFFSPQELTDGWRLSCLHQSQDGMRVQLPQRTGRRRSWQVAADVEAGSRSLSLALDLGTTSLQWQALRDGTPVRAGSELNPQLGAGSEVMSRLAFALKPQGRARLRALVLQRLDAIVRELAPLGAVEQCCIAGNSAMTYVLLDRAVDCLSHAPYHLEYAGGAEERLEWQDSFFSAYIPPLLAPFVGGDLSAGLAWLTMGQESAPEPPYLLADLGTNGEFVLAPDQNSFLTSSVPMGPALEGVGLAYGNVAGPGTAISFEMRPSGPFPLFFEEKEQGSSLSGAAYLSLLSHLLRMGALTKEGHFSENPASPLGLRIIRQLELARGENSLPLAGFANDARLFASDVEEILKVKAAFNVAVACLQKEAGMRTSDLKAIYLSGAFGAHVGANNLEQLGFLPPGMAARTRVMGNTSLQGAVLFLQRPDARAWAAEIAGRSSVLELAEKENFNNMYVKAMNFEYGE